MKGINSECADLIYLDPPFNKKRSFVAPLGTDAEGAVFHDIFLATEMKDEILENISLISVAHDRLGDWLQSVKGIDQDPQKQNYNYLVWMAIRLLECRRILKPTGSIFLHCDDTMSHWLKLTLDFIFDESNFRNEITWQRSRGARGKGVAPKTLGRVTDKIFWYGKTSPTRFNGIYLPVDIEKVFPYVDEAGRRYNKSTPLHCGRSMNPSPGNCYEWRGFRNRYKSGWRVNKQKLEELYQKGEVVIIEDVKERRLERRKFADDYKGHKINDLWLDIKPLASKHKERTGYPTQKPLALLRRIIEATTGKGDVVIDPFCGCATSCEAADDSGRRWVGIDVSRKAHDLILQRLPDLTREIDCSAEVPTRTDNGSFTGDTGFVYVISLKYRPDQYKVGIARDVDRRLASYHTSVPDRDAHQLEYRKSTPHYREIEKHVHDSFEADHEWVRAPLASIIGAIENYPRR